MTNSTPHRKLHKVAGIEAIAAIKHPSTHA
jgi:hypothetical protein